MGSEPKFTKGPWEVPHFARNDVQCDCTGVVCEGYAGAIADIHIDNGKPINDGGNDSPPLEEAIANAHLIAAAPCMFAALIDAWELIVMLGRPEVDDSHDARCEAIRAALSKATGGGNAG